MLHTVTVRTLVIAACGWLLAWEASALTVGRARGAALIGRPLDVAIPVTLDKADPEGPCASADLFYGETRVDRSPTVRWESRGGAEGVLHVYASDPVDEPMVTLYLRVGCVQSSTRRFVLLSELPPQNEASVPPGSTLPVQPPLVASPAMRAQAAAPAAAPSASPARTAPSTGRSPGASTATGPRRGTPAGGSAAPAAADAAPAANPSHEREEVARRAPTLRGEAALPFPAARPVRAAPAQRAKKEQATGSTSRLKLEPLDLSLDRDPTLRLTTELNTQVATDPQRRAAAAALWAALQKSPDEAMQDALRLQGVERELNSLRDVTRQNAAAVGEMRAQVERAHGGRNTASLLVLFLSAVLAALLGWLGWRWHRVRQLEKVGEWFERHGEPVHADAGEAEGAVLDAVAPGGPVAQAPVARPAGGPGANIEGVPVAKAPVAPVPKGAGAQGSVAAVLAGLAGAVVGRAGSASASGARGVPVPDPAATSLPDPVGGAAGASPGSPPAPTTAPVPAPGWSPSAEFQSSRGGTLRMVGVEELIDVHDKADFFLSIGEYDQAIAVLESHVHDQVETSALAWMDLLELYHSLGKRTEYERLRGEFRQRFVAQVPDFDHFDQPSASLESYSRALSRIVALWPSHRVLDVIEESIFRQPGMQGAEPFTLEAYRELVLLYHVAREITPAPQAAQRPAGAPTFPETLLQPLNSLDAPESSILDSSHSEHDLLLIPPASSRLGVDIDVTEPAAMPEDASDAEAQESRLGDLPALDFTLDEPTPRGKDEDLAALDFSLDAPAGDARADDATVIDGARAGAQDRTPAAPAPDGEDAAPPNPGGRELPPLDFDVSAFDDAHEAPKRKHGS